MSFQQAVFGFLHEPVVDGGSNHKVAGVALKISCWLTLVVGAAVVAVLTATAVFVLIGGSFAREIIAKLWESGNEEGVAFILLMLLVMLGVAVVTAALALLWLWWNNTVFTKWNRKEDGALVWLVVFASVSLLQGLGSLLQFSWMDGDTTVRFGGGTNVFALVLGLLMLIFGLRANSGGELAAEPDA